MGPWGGLKNNVFINNTPEGKKSQRTVVTNSRTRKYPRKLIREEYPPRVWRMSVRGASALSQSTFQEVLEVKIDYQCIRKGYECRNILRKSCYHRIKCITAAFLAAFMWRRPLNSGKNDLYPQKIKKLWEKKWELEYQARWQISGRWDRAMKDYIME